MVSLPSDALLPNSPGLRRGMVDQQIRTFDVFDQIVIGRIAQVPREIFVAPEQRALAYSDLPLDLPGEAGPRTRQLLAPLILARMLQAVAPQPQHRVLDVAGGTGYTAALFAGLVQDVVALESDGVLSAAAQRNLAALGLANAKAIRGSLAAGASDHGPFDVIFINGCIEDHLDALVSQLRDEGRIFAIMPKPSGALQAVQLDRHFGDVSMRPLFDATAPRLAEFTRAPAFAF